MRRCGLPEQRDERGPVDDPVAGRGPAVLGRGAGRGGVLGLNDDDLVLVAQEFGFGIGPGAGEPATVNFKLHRLGREDVVDGTRAIGQGMIFEIVVVPGDGQAMPGGLFGALGEGGADAGPEGGGVLAAGRVDPGRDQGAGAQGQRDVDETGGVMDQTVQRHMEAEAFQTGGVQRVAESLWARFVSGKPGLDGVVAHRLQVRQLRLKRREIARGIQLVGDGPGHGWGALSRSNSSSSIIRPRSGTVS